MGDGWVWACLTAVLGDMGLPAQCLPDPPPLPPDCSQVGVPVTGYGLDIGNQHTEFAEAKLQKRLIERVGGWVGGWVDG